MTYRRSNLTSGRWDIGGLAGISVWLCGWMFLLAILICKCISR